MIKFYITEKQDLGSIRKPKMYQARTLSAAKIKATKDQVFRGTVLTIENESGVMITFKKDGRWTDV